MKIAHLTDCYLPRLGGIEMQVHDLAMRQRAAGHEVEIVTATPETSRRRARLDVAHATRDTVRATRDTVRATRDTVRATRDTVRATRDTVRATRDTVRATRDTVRATPDAADGIPVHRLTANLPYELPVHPKAASAVREVLRRGSYDVVHIHAGVVSPFAWAAAPTAVRAGVPTVVTLHCIWGQAAPLFRLLDRRVHWSAWPAVLSAVSDLAAVPVRGIVGPDVEVDVLPNGVDPAEWEVRPVARDPDAVELVSVMRLAPRKRPKQLLRMLRQARELVPARVALHATVIGEGPERRSLERYLRRHDMTDWVELPGRYTREQIRDRYRRADVFIAPANLESFGIAALEARCAGLPVVAKANSGIRDFVVHGSEGLLATTDADMVDAVVRLARSPGLRGDIAAHNRAVLPRVTWDDVLRLTEASYKRAETLQTG